MTKLATITGVSPDKRKYDNCKEFVLNKCFVGIEIEVENIDQRIVMEYHRRNPLSFWYYTSDGSLRNNGLEFVSLKLMGNDINTALTELNEFISSIEVTPEFSERTSVHIHLDVRSLSVQDLQKLLILVIIFERALIRYCGGSRENNVFCLPFHKADTQVSRLSELNSDNPEIVRHIFRSYHKYQGLNLSRISDLGTVEFRHHEGTMDPTRIKNWINLLFCLKRGIGRVGDINDIPNLLSTHGAEEFTRLIFGKHANKLVYTNLEADLYEGVRLAQDAIYGIIPTKRRKTYTNRINVMRKYYKVPDIDEGIDDGITVEEEVPREVRFTTTSPVPRRPDERIDPYRDFLYRDLS